MFGPFTELSEPGPEFGGSRRGGRDPSNSLLMVKSFPEIQSTKASEKLDSNPTKFR